MSIRAGITCLAAAMVILLSPRLQQNAAADPALEARILDLKTKTAELVTAGRTPLDALSPQQRISLPPLIWRVPDALTQFRDCADCPEMVVVPAGEFTMGSPPSEFGAEAQHRVTISYPFAVSKFEITFEEWDSCIEEGGCGGYRPDDEGWGRGKQPVMNISWLDAKSYVEWLSRRTGKTYRLLSESEWEYAARAGTITKFPVGDSVAPSMANYNGSTDGAEHPQLNRQKTLPVGSFRANGFGLYDMLGNVSEWVEDCWNEDYTASAPNDGSAWVQGKCKGRVVRGGSWEDSESELRSAARTGGNQDDRFYTDGLRIARDL
ncbi:MAG TPA: formylglycine-generating enzyme family protein [Xanthobacteraceae bacterium]